MGAGLHANTDDGSDPSRRRLSRRTMHRLLTGAAGSAGAVGAARWAGRAAAAGVLGGASLALPASRGLSAPRPAEAATLHQTPLPPVERAEQFGINEAFRAARFGEISGAGWTRWTVQWFNVQPNPGDLNTHYFRDSSGNSTLEATVRSGIKVAAMVLGTPEWAARNPGLKTGTAVPHGLGEPVFVNGAINPENPWGHFMFQLAGSYKGLMDVFEIWNEVEIPNSGSNALYHAFAGTPEEYFQLLKVASQAAKAANPNARIITSPYAYFRDKQEGRAVTLPWFDTFAGAVRADPAGTSYFDAFSLNIYRNAHDVWDRMHGGVPDLVEQADVGGFRARLRAMGAGDKPIWLTETNSMPYDEDLPGWSAADRNDGFRISKDEQANYVIQAYALGLTAGYEKIFIQALQDDPYPVPDELWGLIRYSDDRANFDPSRVRPGFVAYQVAAKYMGNADWARLFVQLRPDPQGFRRYASRFQWAGHLAVFQRGSRRASVLWSGINEPMFASLAPRGSSARVVDKYGQETPIGPNADGYLSVTLDPASKHFDLFGGDPPGYYYIGGSPVIVVEEDVPPDAPVDAPGYEAMS